MEESEFLYEIFPQGLKVLLVGIDNVTQDSIKTYLPLPFYQITALPEGIHPISFLRDSPNSFDLVISDVVLEHIDSYQFIRDQCLETNIPHVLICGRERSSYDEMMLIAFKYGACYVLLKPVSEVELKNLWQHIYSGREQKGREVVQTEQQPNSDVDDPDQNRQNLNPDKDPKPKSDVEEPDQNRQNLNLDNDPKPKSDVEEPDQIRQNLNPDNDPKPNSDVEDPDQIRQNLNPDKDPKVIVSEFINFVGTSSLKKPRRRRIVWIPELHKKFLYAVENLDGAEKAVPKAILEAMDIPSLTRENVASHLQKYRIHLMKKRMKEQQGCVNLIMPVDRIPPSSPGETSYRRFDNTNDNEVSVLEPCTTPHFTHDQYYQFQHVLAGRKMLTQKQKQPEQNFNYGPVFPQSRLPSSLVYTMSQLNQNPASVSCYVPPIRGDNGGIITPEASNLDGCPYLRHILAFPDSGYLKK